MAAVAELDCCYARAAYAVAHRCARALPLAEGLNLVEARHPLLGRAAVPISLTLQGGTRVLVVTGPNTGGKTVTLKTVGLLALMNQFGLEIPAAEGSSLAVFDEVLADIGDEQSIEQNLSTFSAHVANAARILRGSSTRSLVLFDELGAGTDPEEGVAIAMSLLDHFIQKGCLCLATTHHGVLKNYGYTRAGVGNASMEFDLASLQPTYRILMGVPGESHALEIARRGGIPEELIRSAAGYLQQERGEAADLINRLSRKQRELADAEREQDQKEKQLAERTRQTDLLNLRLRQRERELRRARDFPSWRVFCGTAGGSTSGSCSGCGRKGSPRAAAKPWTFSRPGGAGPQPGGAAPGRGAGEAGVAGPAERLHEGMEVVIRSTGKPGRILRRGKGQRWVVATGSLRAELLPSELAAAPRQAQAGARRPQRQRGAGRARVPPPAGPARPAAGGSAAPPGAASWTTRWCAACPSSAWCTAWGRGYCRGASTDYLRGSALVKDYYFATPEEGGFGKTVVRLA